MPTYFYDLKVWEKSMNLVTEVYRIVKLLPSEERYALSDQMRRSAVSIPSNIAEGHGRYSSREFAQFLSIAKGSLYELTTQLMLCERIKYLDSQHIQPLLAICDEIDKMLSSLIRSISNVNV